jgi:uncharacterized membrane protein YraQ (UPF0718 family)
VILLKKERPQSSTWKNPTVRALLFPALVLVAYGILFAIMPEKASVGLKSSGNIILNMLVPLSLVFILMLVLNLFLKPAQIVKFLGREAGVKGVILSAAAGIISAGPIYAWYPLLKDLREKGAGNTFLAIFLGNRAVKPFLLPIMISYFGWIYVLILTVFTLLGSILVGYFVGALVKVESSLPSRSK